MVTRLVTYTAYVASLALLVNGTLIYISTEDPMHGLIGIVAALAGVAILLTNLRMGD